MVVTDSRRAAVTHLLTALPAFPAFMCILKFTWMYACSCTVNTYVCVCFCECVSPPSLSSRSCVLACDSQQHCNQTITAQGNSALFKQLLFPPLHQNNNYSTILVNHKPPGRLRRVIRRERRSSATLGQHPRRDESQTEQFCSAFQA